MFFNYNMYKIFYFIKIFSTFIIFANNFVYMVLIGKNTQLYIHFNRSGSSWFARFCENWPANLIKSCNIFQCNIFQESPMTFLSLKATEKSAHCWTK
jgi:hypothetical protein